VDIGSIGFLVIQKRMIKYSKDGIRQNLEVRRITEICELSNGISPVFNYNTLLDRLECKNLKHLENILAEKLGIREAELREIISKRKRIIEKSPQKFSESIRYMQKELFGISYKPD
jgi:hypothetical protein